MDKNKIKFQCPCCMNYTLDEEPSDTYQICEVCYWEDDPVQFRNDNYTGGANKVSLKEARTNYVKFGASSKKFVKYVRKPKPEEIPPEFKQMNGGKSEDCSV